MESFLIVIFVAAALAAANIKKKPKTASPYKARPQTKIGNHFPMSIMASDELRYNLNQKWSFQNSKLITSSEQMPFERLIGKATAKAVF